MSLLKNILLLGSEKSSLGRTAGLEQSSSGGREVGWTSDGQEAAAARGKSVPWQGREHSAGRPCPAGIFLGVSCSLMALLRAQLGVLSNSPHACTCIPTCT